MGHLGRHLLRIEKHVVLHSLIERQCDIRIHLGETLQQHLVRDIGSKMDRIHIEDAFHTVPGLPVKIPDIQEAVCNFLRISLRSHAVKQRIGLALFHIFLFHVSCILQRLQLQHKRIYH